MKGNLSRLDNLLINSGIALLVLAVVMGLPLLRYELAMGTSLTSMWSVLTIFAAPLGLLVIGIFVRQREARVEAIWREVWTHGEVPVAALLQMSGFTPTQLEKALQRINRRADARLRWDDTSGRVIDTARGLQDRLAHSAQCAGCGASVSVNVTAHMHCGEVQCRYCSRAVDSAIVNDLQGRLLERATMRGQSARAQLLAHGPMRFNLPIFVVLLAIFWPAAMAYAVWRWRAAG